MRKQKFESDIIEYSKKIGLPRVPNAAPSGGMFRQDASGEYNTQQGYFAYFGYQAAIESQQKKSPWISVDDRLPNKNFDWVLAVADGAIGTIGYSENKGFFEPHPTKTQLVLGEVSHWMPLPSPPTNK